MQNAKNDNELKLVNNILYIEFADFIACGWKEDAIKKANYRNGPFWKMIADPADKRKVLVQFDTLRPKDQQAITNKYGNPYDYISKEPIKKMLELDYEAELFYRQYRYDTNKELPTEHQMQYTLAASWLNLLLRLSNDKRALKKELNISVVKFWESVCDIIKTDEIGLPFTYHRLLAKVKQYETEKYACLIDWRFGNKNTAKLGKTEEGFSHDMYSKQVALIRSLASKHQNFDAMQIADAANKVFELNNWPVISHATVKNICRENSHITLPGRRGKKEWNSTMAMQVKRSRPDMPLKYLTLDGWTVELLFQEANTYNNRLVVVIVLDPMNNYPLGYAIGPRENTELIRMANRNALEHINELFGDYYQPRQLQSDNYGIKNLTPFYSAMAHLHTPAAVGNAKAKVIEPYFAYLNRQYCQKFPNWSGHNITAKQGNQPNTEYLNAVKTNFPNREGVLKQIEMIIAEERRIKMVEYTGAWSLVPEQDKIKMNRMDMLMVYGVQTKYTNALTGMGLIISIGGQKITYDSFDPKFRELQYQKWNVVFDPCDASSIMAIGEVDKRRFLLEQKRAIPMDIASMTDEDHQYLSKINEFNQKAKQRIVDTYIQDAEVVREVLGNTPLQLDDFNEASIKLMFTSKGQQKEALQDAKGLQEPKKKEPVPVQQNPDEEWNQTQLEYLRSKIETDYFNED